MDSAKVRSVENLSLTSCAYVARQSNDMSDLLRDRQLSLLVGNVLQSASTCIGFSISSLVLLLSDNLHQSWHHVPHELHVLLSRSLRSYCADSFRVDRVVRSVVLLVENVVDQVKEAVIEQLGASVDQVTLARASQIDLRSD